LDQVTGAELEGEIPSYAEHDDFIVGTLSGGTEQKVAHWKSD
jgi:hypothetical protein